MSKTGTRKRPKAAPLAAELFKGKKLFDSTYLDPGFRASKTGMRSVRKAKLIHTVVYWTDMPLRTVIFDDCTFAPIPRTRSTGRGASEGQSKRTSA